MAQTTLTESQLFKQILINLLPQGAFLIVKLLTPLVATGGRERR